MKVNVEVDCTPDEARRFLGLPDVAPIQEAVMQAMQKRVMDVVATSDPKVLMEQWMPMGFKAMEGWPNLWAQIAATAANFPRPPVKAKKD